MYNNYSTMQYSSSFENYSSTVDSPRKLGGKDDKGYVYQKSNYQYGNTSKNNTSYSNQYSQDIDQLDSLLEDLKNERQITRDRDILSSSTNFKTVEKNEPYGTITKTTRVLKSSQYPTDIESFSSADCSTSRSHGNNNIYHSSLKLDEYNNNDKQQAGTSFPLSMSSENRYKIYENNHSSADIEILPTVSTTTAKDIETDLKNIALTGEILPLPGTKVTTTVRTYTYEIPADTSSTTNTISRNQNIIYKNYVQNETKHMDLPQTQPMSETTKNQPSRMVYNTESYSTLNRGYETPLVNNKTYEMHEHRETNTLRNAPPLTHSHVAPGGSTTQQVIYNVNTTENIDNIENSQNYTQNTPIPGTLSTTSRNLQHLHGPQPTNNTYFYKETSNIVNTIKGPGSSNEPILKSSTYETKQFPTIYSPQTDKTYPIYGTPNQSNNIYKYSSNTTTNIKYDQNSPNATLAPAPFPVDGIEQISGNPPQKVDELMQSFGNADAVDKSDINMPHRKREVETAVASPNQLPIPSINRAGKEVYYPPGHDTMITKREEMSASGASGGGRWAKGSGMYEYESGYKSKSKTKSGGAMVPVCLPLCCAMPCSIM